MKYKKFQPCSGVCRIHSYPGSAAFYAHCFPLLHQSHARSGCPTFRVGVLPPIPLALKPRNFLPHAHTSGALASPTVHTGPLDPIPVKQLRVLEGGAHDLLRPCGKRLQYVAGSLC